ncbi:MAG: hypothetical protein QXG10_02585 [Candidatus Hadarchaeales archaeon]
MAEYGRGIKAGVVAGIIYGIILLVLVIALADALMPGFWTIAGAAGLAGPAIAIFATGMVVGGIIGGLIFGVIYAAAYGSLPGTSVVKGIILGIIFWLIFSVALNYGTVITYPLYALLGLIASLIWGALVGFFWDKFGK